jgi:hypothetical protein
VEATLWERERNFWTGDAEYYRHTLADPALMVFRGVALDRKQTIDSIAGAPRWTSVAFDQQRSLALSDDVVALHYVATAQREGDGSPYHALVTSVYVRRGADWLLAVHQQTP